jgi:hypothetical protein
LPAAAFLFANFGTDFTVAHSVISWFALKLCAVRLFAAYFIAAKFASEIHEISKRNRSIHQRRPCRSFLGCKVIRYSFTNLVPPIGSSLIVRRFLLWCPSDAADLFADSFVRC